MKNCSPAFYRTLPALVLMTLMLHGCGVKRTVPPYPQSPSYPSSPSSPSYPSYPEYPEQVISPGIEKPAEPYTPKTGAASALYSSAQAALSNNEYHQAELAMERALRIEPRNSHYWYTMAKIKYQQKQYNQAMNLCFKSKSFAGKNTRLLAMNDSLIQQARQQLGQ